MGFLRKSQSYEHVVHPFDSWPETVPMANGWHIRARHLTAFRAKFSKGTITFCKMISVNLVLLAVIVHESSALVIIITAIIAVFLLLWWKTRRYLWAKRTDIKMSGRTLRIGKHLFDLSLPHQFDMAPHPKRPMLEFRERTPAGVPRYSYYDNTWLVRIQYGGSPIPLMEVYSDSDAAEIVARLQAIDQILQVEPKEKTNFNSEGD